MKPKSLAAIAVAAALSLAAAAPAAAAPVWNLDIHHNQTHFPPGGTAQYWFDVNNVGDTATTGKTTLTVQLPAGLGFAAKMDSGFPDLDIQWECPGASAGDTTIVCETSEPIPRHRLSRRLILQVAVDPEAAGTLTTTATLSGGGAGEAAAASEPTPIEAAPAGFGIVEESFVMDFFEPDGLTPVRQAGSHPPLLTSAFDFNSVDTGMVVGSSGVPIKRESESLRNIEVDLPPGFLGNPTAVGECSQAQFTVGECPPSSQVGRFDAAVYPTQASAVFNFTTGVFNLTHPRGAVTDLGFVVAGNPVHIRASLDPARDYAITTTVPNVNETLPPFNSKVTIWGVPADPSHDSERCPAFSPGGSQNGGDTGSECSAGIPERPFLTVPTRCEGANVMRLRDYDSWQDPGDFGPDIARSLPGQFEGCEKPRFEPRISLDPTGREAGAPTGLDVHVHVPQNENPNALATPPLHSTVVALPEGMAVNPSFADGLTGCSEAQIGLGTNDPVRCPDSSRMGVVELSTPLLPKPIEGSIYLASQEANPFGSLLALYLVLRDTEQRGVLVKVPGEISLDPDSGQITTTFTDLPQFPFEDLTLSFRSGPRAPLVNPPTCGRHEIEATMTSHARPSEEVDLSSSYTLSEGANGAPCAGSEAARPFDPELLAGTLNPLAGAFSPLLVRVSRNDSEQELARVEGTAPPGLVASLRGVARCSEPQIAAARARGNPGQGASEIASPSCPAAAQIGTVQTGAGAGPNPIYVPGKVYLAGPYKGAAISGVAIVPAVAGPVDLGNVVVRAPAFVDPKTAQVRLVSDPLPQIVNGVLIRVRDVRIVLDRPGFTLNPTNCQPASFDARLQSTAGAVANESQRFQVGGCASLDFRPRLAIRLLGGVRRGAFPALRAVVTPPPGQANFARAAVTLPDSAFVEQGHFGNVCTRVQFAAGAGHGSQCPPRSRYGFARAWSPLLDAPAQGPVYLRSSDNELPDLVIALHGPASAPIDVELSAKIDSVNGALRSTFAGIPDIPVSRFILRMQGGKKGLIVNSRHLCFKPRRNMATSNLRGQNGRVSRTKLRVISATCAKRRRAARRKARRAAAERSAVRTDVFDARLAG